MQELVKLLPYDHSGLIKLVLELRQLDQLRVGVLLCARIATARNAGVCFALRGAGGGATEEGSW